MLVNDYRDYCLRSRSIGSSNRSVEATLFKDSITLGLEAVRPTCVNGVKREVAAVLAVTGSKSRRRLLSGTSDECKAS